MMTNCVWCRRQRYFRGGDGSSRTGFADQLWIRTRNTSNNLRGCTHRFRVRVPDYFTQFVTIFWSHLSLEMQLQLILGSSLSSDTCRSDIFWRSIHLGPALLGNYGWGGASPRLTQIAVSVKFSKRMGARGYSNLVRWCLNTKNERFRIISFQKF